MIVEIFLLLATVFCLYLWIGCKNVEKLYDKKGVKFLPGVPLLGNQWNSTMKKCHIFDDFDRVYKAFPDERYVGFLDSSNKPAYLIRDPDLIKAITVKDFDHFTDHKLFVSEHIEPMFASSLFSMKGEKWRAMRSTLTPAFTGSKMKLVMGLMVDISKNYAKHLKHLKNQDVDIGDFMRRFTNDVIASSSFGLEIDSLKHRDNEFFEFGQIALSFNVRQIIVVLLDQMFPSLVKKLGITFRPRETYDYFSAAVEKTFRHRRENNVTRPDMLQLLIETPIEWTPKQLTAQAFIFFIAGFETSASVLTMAAHELALNPDVEEKLYQEIRRYEEEGNELTFDGLNSLKYLDCVVNETLRRWSPSVMLDRTCTKKYVLPPPHEGGKPVVVNPGEVVFNSSNSIHLDPLYWPDPLRFDPERWSDDNKQNIKPFTFQPFGCGPRICIGSRFALLEIKVLLYHIVRDFKITRCEKTVEPIILSTGFNIHARGGSWVKFEERL